LEMLHIPRCVRALGKRLYITAFEPNRIMSSPHVGSAIDFLKGNPRYVLLVFELELRRLELTKLARALISPRESHREHLPIVRHS
jgi:hypothetical protein